MIRVRWLHFPLALALAVFFGGTGSSCVFGAEDALAPAGPELYEGQPLTLRAEVEGGQGPFHYQWYKDYVPISHATHSELTFDALRRSDAGSYWVTVFNDAGSVTSVPEVIIVRPAQPSRLANVSISGSARDSVIVGFTVGGNSAAGTAEIFARAAGPALVQFGVTNAMADPVLSLFERETLLTRNDDWGGNALLSATATAVGAFPFSSASKDSAVLLSLSPSMYSAHVVDGNNGTGITVVELYDTSIGTADRSRPRLVQVSARGASGIEGAPLTAGFTIQGGEPVKVLVRGIGPSLGQLGISGALADPRVNLYQGQVLLSSNDNWGDVAPAEIVSAERLVGAFPLEAKALDAALLVPLRPGSYTVQVSGSSGPGIALIEVFEVP